MRRAVNAGRSNVSILGVVLVAIGLVVASSVPSSAQTAPRSRFVSGELLVKFKPAAGANERATAHRAAGATLLAQIPRTNVHRVRVPAGTEAEVIARYQRNPNVLYAELNFIRSVPESISGSSQSVPADHSFPEQWALNNTGQSFYCIPWIGGDLCFYSGTADADIDAPEAWAVTRGSAAVTVAVIDSGVDSTHPDIAPNYAGGDDFTSPDGNPMDDNGHGTHVAGTIAAAADNLTGTPGVPEGVSGVAPHARIKAYKVCLADGSCDDFAVQQGIARAITDGANIINMSLGGTEYSQSLNDAVQDAWNAGLVIVAGAGNDGTTELFYPAAFDHVVSVGAFDEDGARAYFSNYGSWVDIAAPGNAILSTYPMSVCGVSTTPGDTGCYEYLSGTSMATPHVSGAAALVWSRGDVTTNQQVVDVLLNSAEGKGVSGARLDSWTVHGGLNLHDAIVYGLSNLPPVADAGPDRTVSDTNGDGSELVNLDGSASHDSDGSITAYTWREGTNQIATGATTSVWLTDGVHTLTLEVTDDDGDSATDTAVITVERSNKVSVTVATAQATEAGPTSGTFVISRTGDTSAPLTVHLSVSGSATAGTDYVAIPNAVTIDAAAASASVAVAAIDDTVFESDETVVLTLTADPTYSLGSPTQATVTIVSDDLPSDLTVSSVTVPTLGAADADMPLADTTANKGTGGSPSSKTAFYLSLNTTIDGSDVLLGTRTVPALAAGASDSSSTTVHVPAGTLTGTYYVLAKADSDGVVSESSETNNMKVSGAIRIGPDLLMTALTAPASAAAGTSFSVSDTTKNQGGGSSDVSVTRFYLSLNALLETSDVALGERAVTILAAGGASTANTTLLLPSGTAPGTYYVIAQADGASTVRETTEGNNTKVSSTVKVGADLVVTSIAAPANAGAGMTISVTDATKNQGPGAAPPSSTGFYLSTNLTVGAGDVFLGSRDAGELAVGVTGTGSVSVQIPAGTAAGVYYVVGTADWNNTVAEATETNNDRASGPIKVGADLIVSAISASTTGTAGGSITVTDTTNNQSAVTIPESTTAFYLSTDFAYNPSSDVLLGSRTVPSLQPSGTSTASTPVVIPSGTAPGTYYVIGVADANNVVIENTETNNTRNSGSVKIGPDLIVALVNAPASAAAGTSITASDTTTNQGAGAAQPSSTSFYLSSNAVLDGADLRLASRAVPSLGPNVSNTGSVTLVIPASTSAGTWYIIAKSDGDDVLAESTENNNTRGKSITITAVP
jgi:subtilisin family serine protease/subtilase family serine protease